MEGGQDIGAAIAAGGDAGKAAAIILDKGGDLAKTVGDYMHRADDAKQKAAESQIQIIAKTDITM